MKRQRKFVRVDQWAKILGILGVAYVCGLVTCYMNPRPYYGIRTAIGTHAVHGGKLALI